MEDKEVGELWKKAKLPAVIQLIRKIVDERALAIAKNYYQDCEIGDHETLSCVKAALRDFGIDPETWEKK